MGFKVGMIGYVASLARQGKGKLVFDNEREALAELLMENGEYVLRYLNGGLAILKMNLLIQLETVELPWVLTHSEMLAWQNGLDRKTPKENVIFDGNEIPKEWWATEDALSEKVFECA